MCVSVCEEAGAEPSPSAEERGARSERGAEEQEEPEHRTEAVDGAGQFGSRFPCPRCGAQTPCRFQTHRRTEIEKKHPRESSAVNSAVDAAPSPCRPSPSALAHLPAVISLVPRPTGTNLWLRGNHTHTFAPACSAPPHPARNAPVWQRSRACTRGCTQHSCGLAVVEKSRRGRAPRR